ncbi:hypothetical protein QM092_09210 [Enterobacter hormaechei]|uniref:hypothetical protein n=1 Tax=Enterobacter hormaechei TaxID=158836 RepID=UPI00294A3969|nr:hypothetical protein [Enterobacter hormaechei]MDV5370203.1 hypothetical protein [Enterobacter hormaechei]HBM2681102.1 hypothetical protein [Enterobacter hormaechei]
MKLNYEELEAKCAALAEENAGLKSAIDAAIGWQQSTDSENVESVRMLVDVKSPATDAFLTEMRAQGVEMFAKEMHADISGDDAREFAAQIRKGAAS